MQTQSIVEASATVVTITSLRSGDVYKRLPSDNEYRGTVLIFGIIQSIMHNGTDSAFTAIEFDSGSSNGLELKVHKGGADLKIFPATPDEILLEIDNVTATAQRKVSEAEDALAKVKAQRDAIAHQRQRITEGQVLTAPTAEMGVIDGEVA